MRVYLCLDWNTMNGKMGWPILGLHQFPVLVSAAALWQKTNGRRLWMPDLPPHRELLLDSGAFSLLGGMEDYPFSFEDYLKAAEHLGADLVAARDWPCEPWGKISMSIPERIERTVEANVQLVDADLPNGSRPLAVIQGWEREDYRRCIDLMRERGVLTDTVAIGSCCKRGSIREIMDIARMVREELPITNLHYFGLKVQAFRQPGFHRLADSTDTGAWAFAAKAYWPWTDDGKCSLCGKPQTEPGSGHFHKLPLARQRLDALYRYLPKLEETPQRALEDFQEVPNGP